MMDSIDFIGLCIAVLIVSCRLGGLQRRIRNLEEKVVNRGE